MKKIIGGKVYNTDTAELVGKWSNGRYTNDFSYCSEDLYRKRTGEFFLHGAGGAMSKYTESRGNNWAGSEKIIPLTYNMAKSWAEEHLSSEVYEKTFGEIEEDNDKKIISLSLTVGAHEKIKQICAQRGETVSQAIEKIINNL